MFELLEEIANYPSFEYNILYDCYKIYLDPDLIILHAKVGITLLINLEPITSLENGFRK